MSLVRVPIAGTVGKAVRINTDATEGATLGVNLYDSDGNVLDAAALALLLAVEVNEIINEGVDGTIYEEDIDNGDILARVADPENITGAWDFTNLTSDYIQFDIAYSDGTAEGKLSWDTDHGALQVGMPGGNVDLLIGQQMLIRCRNTTGVTIPIGSIVYMTGVSGHKPLIALADASSAATSDILGVTTEEFLHNSNGYITTQGLVHGVNTLGMTPGAVLFLSETAGKFTETRPTAPAIGSHIGHVVEAHADTGAVLVTIFEHTTLGSEVSDVIISGIASGELLQWDGSTWINQTFAELGLNVANWNSAYGWGDHSLVGYLTSETSHADVLVDADIGVNVQAYDATILVDADIGVNVQAYDATILVDADIGVNVAAFAHTHEGTAIDATAVTDGFVLTADGAGNAAWEAAAGGGGGTWHDNDTLGNRDTGTPDVAGDGGEGVYFHYLTAEYPVSGFDDPTMMTLVYSADWQTQVAFDFYNHGRLAVRAQDSGTWTDWSLVWDDVSLPAADIATYETAYGWGDHAGLYAAAAHTHEGSTIDATAVTDGYVLTADGAGNAAWEAAAGGGLSNIVEDTTPELGGHLDTNGFVFERSSHHTGYLEGGYNKVGSSGSKSNPIYSMGSSFVPTDAALGNMYGIGYCHKNATFINITDLGTEPTGWGMYVATNGTAKIWLESSDGHGYFKGTLFVTGGDSSDWITAHGWGDHGAAGYLGGITATAAEVNLLDLAGLTVGWVLSADSATTASWKAAAGGGGGLANIVEDLTPQLGATLDANTFNIDMGTNVLTDALLGPLLATFAQNGTMQSTDVPDTVGDGGIGAWIGYIGTGDPPGFSSANILVLSYDNDYQTQLAMGYYGEGLATRGQDSGVWSDWSLVWDDNNLALTATAAEINLLDLAGLTAGWVLSADTATTASWKAPAGGGGAVVVGDIDAEASADGYVITSDGAGNAAWEAAGGGGIANVVEDTTPQLGGDLDMNGKLLTAPVKISGSDDQLWIIDTDDSVAGEHFRIRRTSGVTWFEYYNGTSYELHMRHDDNGGVRLYHNGNQRLITTDAGFIVSGLVNVSTYIQNAEWSSAQLGDSGNAVNTGTGKIEGAQVWDVNNNLPLWATGGTPTSTWIDGAGNVIHTPS